MTTPVPEEAVRLALVARAHALIDRPDPMVLSDEQLTRQMLQAAAPVLTAASDHASDLAYLKGLEDGIRTERERIAVVLHAAGDWDEIRALTAALAAGKDGAS